MSRTVAVDNTAVYDESYTVQQLREIAKEKEIKGYSSMTKTELLKELNSHDISE